MTERECEHRIDLGAIPAVPASVTPRNAAGLVARQRRPLARPSPMQIAQSLCCQCRRTGPLRRWRASSWKFESLIERDACLDVIDADRDNGETWNERLALVTHRNLVQNKLNCCPLRFGRA